EKNITMVVDECFLGFLPSKEAVTLKSFLGEFPNLFLLRAFTKDYALPGIRLGYGMSSSVECIEAIQRVGQPWSVSLLAQAAGVQALKESLYREQTQQLIEEEKEYLFQELKRLGYYVLYPAANYIFFCLPKGGKERIAAFVEGLKEKGILIRNCGNYLGLGEEDGYFRVAVKSHQENIQLVNALNASEQ
ncbi:MAG: aminotransferase class I/II-fold pyridoxal phosphate-dependent enzyme, partial [Anaerovoracaceae bacterium]